MTTMRSIDQKRAEHAWKAIRGIKADAGNRDDYAREAKKLPVRIMTAGLGQALAFLYAKKDKKAGLEKLLNDLKSWVVKAGTGLTHSTLLLGVIEGNSDKTVLFTSEVLAYLQWLNRFAEGEGLPSKEHDED